MYRYLLAFLVLSASVFADYTEIYKNSDHMLIDMNKLETGYLVNGTGRFLARIDSNSNVEILMQSSNSREINFVTEYENIFYCLVSNMENQDAFIVKTDDFIEYETVFTSKNLGAMSIIVNQNGMILPVYSNGKSKIVRVEHDNIIDVLSLSNVVIDFKRLSENEIIALGFTPNNSIIYSNDSGLNFKEIPLNDQNLTRLNVNKSNIFVSSTDGRLIKSTDKGISWITLFDDNAFNGSTSLYIANNDTIYFAPSVNDQRSILYKTEDGGVTWKEVYRLDSEAITSILVDGNKAILGTTSGKILYNDNFTSLQEWSVIEPNSLKVFPNPSTDYLTIDTKEKIESFKIVDMLGNDVTANVTLEGKTLDLTALASGTYTLVVDGKTAQIAVNR